ncbi:hypothetical protein K503DRAFT_773730 [Rhizopogon vinicolor AM-OR11-026]|uniref:Uncharacterized protein n=1 Tax=Rhizopogon vinicolor AM-OR11-026 TaxID=1314800 RepID=A0A1B7MRI6_9AGAM|nr:hypothetical protein K503DRAFT_773730 [Rhizopogon vinicolor AM-OR11-026]
MVRLYMSRLEHTRLLVHDKFVIHQVPCYTKVLVMTALHLASGSTFSALSFISLGEGASSHNMGKVYSGLYKCTGHIVLYLVVVAV